MNIDYSTMPVPPQDEIHTPVIGGAPSRAQVMTPPSNGTIPPSGLAQHWQIRTLADAYQERPPTQYVLSGLLPMPSVSIWFGPPGCMKSALLADMAACVAIGKPWLGPIAFENSVGGHSFETMQTPVLWLDFDNGSGLTDERIGAFSKAHQLPEDAPLFYVSMPSPWLDASNEAMMLLLVDLVRNLQAGLIIVDNLGNVSGGTGENDNSAMQLVMSNFKKLSESTGSAVLIVHHQRKGGSGDNRKGEALRGGSAIEAALDLAVLITREEGTDEITCTPTKVRRFTKTGIFGAAFTYQHKPGTHDFDTAMFYAHQVESKKQTVERIIREEIIEQLRDLDAADRPNKGTLVDNVRGAISATGERCPGRDKVTTIVAAMQENGDIILELGGHGAKRYYLPVS